MEYRNYISNVRNCLHNYYLYQQSLGSNPYPFEFIVDEYGEFIGLEAHNISINLTSNDKIVFSESTVITNEQELEVSMHKFQFIPSNPNKDSGWWYFRVDLEENDHEPHGNHDNGHEVYYDNDWPHHLIPGSDINLDIYDFNLYIFSKLVLTYNSNKEKYPFENDFSDFYNRLINRWKRQIT